MPFPITLRYLWATSSIFSLIRSMCVLMQSVLWVVQWISSRHKATALMPLGKCKGQANLDRSWVWVSPGSGVGHDAQPISFQMSPKTYFWSKTEGVTANFAKFIKISCLSLISRPFWMFLDSFWQVNPPGYGYGCLRVRVQVIKKLPMGHPCYSLDAVDHFAGFKFPIGDVQ